MIPRNVCLFRERGLTTRIWFIGIHSILCGFMFLLHFDSAGKVHHERNVVEAVDINHNAIGSSDIELTRETQTSREDVVIEDGFVIWSHPGRDGDVRRVSGEPKEPTS